MNAKTKIYYTKHFSKQLEKVPDHLKNKFRVWVFSVENLGIIETMKCKGFHDEPLRGVRFGQRSIRLNRSYRVIYRLIENHIKIELLEVNKHEY
jgi:proteic killer suppression protein